MKNVKLVLGTMTFGDQVFGNDVTDMVNCFLGAGYRELDTAYVYNGGESERLTGEALKNVSSDAYSIATKVNPRITGRLDGDAVFAQFNESLERLQVPRVDTLYLHFPDPNTPVESALEACAKLYDEGKFSELGLSNFPAWLVAEVYHICLSHGWMLPKVFEGLYNPLSRHAERELITALKHYKMRFYAYNPLAGGMLTNKYSNKDGEIKDGRFTHRLNYQQRYWKESYFDAVRLIKDACEIEGIDIVEASYRWMAHHSMLSGDREDGIIIGASRLSQLEQNIETVEKGPLPESILSAYEEAWHISKTDAPEYFKYYQGK